jgi:hypothetical protein
LACLEIELINFYFTKYIMAFNGTEGGKITLRVGGDMTAEYRNNNPNELLAHFFGKDILLDILNQNGCMGIRMYYALNAEGVKELVIVGADEDENDMTDLVADLSRPCPDHCSKDNPLNS